MEEEGEKPNVTRKFEPIAKEPEDFLVPKNLRTKFEPIAKEPEDFLAPKKVLLAVAEPMKLRG